MLDLANVLELMLDLDAAEVFELVLSKLLLVLEMLLLELVFEASRLLNFGSAFSLVHRILCIASEVRRFPMVTDSLEQN